MGACLVTGLHWITDHTNVRAMVDGRKSCRVTILFEGLPLRDLHEEDSASASEHGTTKVMHNLLNPGSQQAYLSRKEAKVLLNRPYGG